MNAPLMTKNDPPDASLPSGRFYVDGRRNEVGGMPVSLTTVKTKG